MLLTGMGAEYLGTYVTEYKTELMFASKDVMKGTLDTDDSEGIYVAPRSGELSEEDPAVSEVYIESETYLLFWRNTSPSTTSITSMSSLENR